MSKAYISGALTNLPAADKEAQKRYYERLGDTCRKIGMEAHVPHLHSDPDLHRGLSPREVYNLDVAAIRSCSLLIADLTYPSFGVGGEIEVAREANILIVALWREKTHVSRFPRGNPAIVDCLIYSDLNEACSLLAEFLKTAGEIHSIFNKS